MKIINIPTPVYETGDRVLTDKGKATVIHDELEDFDTEGDPEQRAYQAFMQNTVIVRLDGDPTEQDAHESRSSITLIE
jgi:hypothetical protein